MQRNTVIVIVVVLVALSLLAHVQLYKYNTLNKDQYVVASSPGQEQHHLNHRAEFDEVSIPGQKPTQQHRQVAQIDSIPPMETPTPSKTSVQKLNIDDLLNLMQEDQNAQRVVDLPPNVSVYPTPAPTPSKMPLNNPAFFATSQDEQNCEKLWGVLEMPNARDSKTPMCVPFPNEQTGNQTSIYYYKHVRRGIFITEFENLALSVQYLHLGGGNFIGMHCDKQVNALTSDCVPHVIRGLYSSGRSIDIPNSLPVEQKFVLFVNRDGSSNLFHCMMDHLMAFYTLVTIGIHHRDVIVVLTDNDGNHPNPGMYEVLWQAVSDHKVLMAREFYADKVLIRHGAFASLAGCSIGWTSRRDYGNWLCPGASTVVKSFARNVLDAFKLFDVPPPSKPTILFISRKKNNERNQPRVGRQVKNEDELIKALSCDKSIIVQSVDFTGMPFLDQLKLVRGSNILVGMHGAALTHLMFMPEEAVVVEMFPMNWNADTFRSLARMTGKTYISWQNTNPKNHFPDNGIERGQGDKQATTYIDVDEFLTVMTVAINIARNFATGFSQQGLACN